MPQTETDFQPNSITMEFIQHFPKALRDSNLSEADFAKKLDWNATTLSLVKNKKRNIPIDVWERFQNLFKNENNMNAENGSTLPLIEHYQKMIALYEDMQRTKDEVLKSNAALSQAVANLSMMRNDVDSIKTNLNDAARKQQNFRAMSSANQRVALETMALQQGMSKDALVKTARSLGLSLMALNEEVDNFDYQDNSGK